MVIWPQGRCIEIWWNMTVQINNEKKAINAFSKSERTCFTCAGKNTTYTLGYEKQDRDVRDVGHLDTEDWPTLDKLGRLNVSKKLWEFGGQCRNMVQQDYSGGACHLLAPQQNTICTLGCFFFFFYIRCFFWCNSGFKEPEIISPPTVISSYNCHNCQHCLEILLEIKAQCWCSSVFTFSNQPSAGVHHSRAEFKCAQPPTNHKFTGEDPRV